MNRKALSSVALILLTGLLLTFAASCVGMHGQSTLDAIQGSIAENKPIVEAFVEYPGPQERWAGPSSLVVHITARDGVEPTVTLTPGVFQAESGVSDFSTPVRKSGLTTQVVRERLALVATALTQAGLSTDEKQGGCLSPVRARLIKSDGSIIEKRGCRSQTGWAFQASDAATDLIAAADSGSRDIAGK
jgi:hypothetical protein